MWQHAMLGLVKGPQEVRAEDRTGGLCRALKAMSELWMFPCVNWETIGRFGPEKTCNLSFVLDGPSLLGVENRWGRLA